MQETSLQTKLETGLKFISTNKRTIDVETQSCTNQVTVNYSNNYTNLYRDRFNKTNKGD